MFYSGFWAWPIFKRDYPEIIKYRVGDRLVKFSDSELDLISGSSDFFGLNHYTSEIVHYDSSYSWPSCDSNETSRECDNPDSESEFCENWASTSSSWFKVAPWGFRKILNWIDHNYDSIPIFVTENGYSSDDRVSDDQRSDYYEKYLNEMLKATKIDGVNVIGYAAWSLLDNFEWNRGYEERFGLFSINYTSGLLDRVPKSSVFRLKTIYENRGWNNQNSTTEQAITTENIITTSHSADTIYFFHRGLIWLTVSFYLL